MPSRFCLLPGLALGLTALGGAHASVVQVAAGGFTVRNVVTVQASAHDAFEALVNDVGKWWNPAHTYSQDSGNLSIDARPGGCFCERLPAGGGVLHMLVVNVQPVRLLRLTGALGPLQNSGASGALTWEFEAVPRGTQITLTYSVGGLVPQSGLQPLASGNEGLARTVDGVLADQLKRLAAFVDKSP
jgi:hypothetical protein